MIEGVCHCGGVRWVYAGVPESVTACNCTICRRYGALWAYGFDNDDVQVSGATRLYAGRGKWLDFHLCATCGCVAYWRQSKPGADGRQRVGVNLRMAEPEVVAALPLRQHDGLGAHDDLPPNGRTVADIWF